MRWSVGGCLAVVMLAAPVVAEANERSLKQLPGDVWSLATEPIKSVARETRRVDPITGLWYGLMEGSMKSIQRTANLFLHNDAAVSSPHDPARPQARYSF